jgi:hypothetical protein
MPENNKDKENAVEKKQGTEIFAAQSTKRRGWTPYAAEQ